MAVEILAEFGGKLDCTTCDDKLKEERGHDKKGIIPFLVGGERVFRCPLMLVSSQTWEYITAYGFFEKNILPNGNCWGDETNKFNEAMTILGNEFKKAENKGN